MLTRFMARGFIYTAMVALAITTVATAIGTSPASRAQHRHDGSHTVIYSDDSAAWLGVGIEEEVDHPDGGARVTRVHDDSPAWRAGLREGDIVIRFDGETVRGPRSLTHRVRRSEPGDSVEITVLRDGREETMHVELGSAEELVERIMPDLEQKLADLEIKLEGLEVNLGELDLNLEHLDDLDLSGIHELDIRIPDIDIDLSSLSELSELAALSEIHDHDGTSHYVKVCEDGDCRSYRSDHGRRPTLGVQLVSMTPELRRHLGSDEDSGVLIDRVLRDTPAEQAGIQVGDVIVAIDGRTVADAGDVRRGLRDRKGRTVDVELLRDGSPLTIAVDLPANDRDD